jgi:hypothetical protein
MPTPLIDRAQVTVLLDAAEPIKPADMMKVLRYLAGHCDEQENKIRQLKSELGRVARKG